MMYLEKVPVPYGIHHFSSNIHGYNKADTGNGMVNTFLRTRKMDARLNMTNICLIPKTKRLTRMSELRPIRLYNVGYKIISKILCQLLRSCLPKLISETQSAIVAGVLVQTIS